jgi:integration host factor subunit beta
MLRPGYRRDPGLLQKFSLGVCLNFNHLNMTKSELINILDAKFREIPTHDTEMSVNVILDAMAKTLSDLDRIEIRGFGSFTINHRSARKARNPKTGEPVYVEEKAAPHFKAGAELKHRINKSLNPIIKLAA